MSTAANELQSIPQAHFPEALAPNIDEIKRTLVLIHSPGDVAELRTFDTPEKTWSGYYNNSSQMSKDAANLSARPTTPNMYHTLQAIDPSLFARRPNTMTGWMKDGDTTPDEYVLSYRWFPLDADPKRPGKISASDKEKALALDVIFRVRKFLSDHGIESIFADSGNGYHLLVRIDLPVSDKAFVQQLLKAFVDVFSTDKVSIDEKVFNPARIWKLYGSPARKGGNLPDRPWRMSMLIDVPAGIETRPVSRAALEILLKDLQALAEPTVRYAGAAASSVTPEMIEAEAARLDIKLGPRKDYKMDGKPGLKWQLDCPFNPDHESPDAWIGLPADGDWFFSCSHNSCESHGRIAFSKEVGGFSFERTHIPIVDDPSEDDPRFQMTGETFDTKVYEDIAQRFTPYPDPGEGDLISLLARKLVHGTNIPLAYVREPLKAIILHALDGKLVHPAFPKMSLRGSYFSLGESESGKTTGLEFAMEAADSILRASDIYAENLFRYKSETTFIRSFTPEGTIKRDKDGTIKSGHAGHPSQFLYIKEGNLVANCSDYFGAVFSQLTNLYDQTEAGTESMTNGSFCAAVVKASTVMCFTPTDYKAAFGGKGTIGGGGLNRWGLTNPPEDHSYDDKDWKRLDDSVIRTAVNNLAKCVFELSTKGQTVLEEEPGAQQIRLEVKSMLKKSGKVGKRLLDYFMREQVAQAAAAVDRWPVMTAEQAAYAKSWVEAQLQCRLNCWPADSANQIEVMEHAIRKAVKTHHVSEKTLKDVCHFYREGSGGWFVYNAARNNALASQAIKLTGKTRKGTRAYCPGSCAIHQSVRDAEDKPKK